MEAVKVSSEKRVDEHINLALVTDGLKSEREQGTIDAIVLQHLSEIYHCRHPGHINYKKHGHGSLNGKPCYYS